MADIFVSYARADKARVAPLVAALEAEGWSVWWDPAIAPGQEFDDLITAELERARAVIVVWTEASVASRWVRGEARYAADRGKLVPVRFGPAALPLDARAIHTTDLDGWRDDRSSVEYKELTRALGSLLGARDGQGPEMAAESSTSRKPEVAVLVLPFANMSGDPEQEYFSDGISEDIITDLSKVSALWVAARNTAFAYKGKHVDVPQVARQQKVSHVLEGSVRKSGNRVRITAQLIDGASGGHVWAERYDRDLDDIFALQDEISQAIVAALKCKLLPEERRAIEHRGTTNAEAYRLYLMARKYRDSGNIGNLRGTELAIRLCKKALELDPLYTRAWALLALTQASAKLYFGGPTEDGSAAARRAIELDANLAEAHAAMARVLNYQAQYEKALKEISRALALDPDSYEANREAGIYYLATRDFPKAIEHFERAVSLVEGEYYASGMVVTAYGAVGDAEGTERAARRVLARAEKLLAVEPDHGSALSFAVTALTALKDSDRAKEWAQRGLLLDPENLNMRYNFACSFVEMGDHDTAIEMLEPVFASVQIEAINWSKVDSDLDPIREDPRFKAMIAAAEARLAHAGSKN